MNGADITLGPAILFDMSDGRDDHARIAGLTLRFRREMLQHFIDTALDRLRSGEIDRDQCAADIAAARQKFEPEFAVLSKAIAYSEHYDG